MQYCNINIYLIWVILLMFLYNKYMRIIKCYKKWSCIFMLTTIVSFIRHICWRYEIGHKLGEGGFGFVHAGTLCKDGLKVSFYFTYPSFYLQNFAYLFRIHNWSDISSMHMIIVISLLCWVGGYGICWEDATHAIGLHHTCEYYCILLHLSHCFQFIKFYIHVNHRLQIISQ